MSEPVIELNEVFAGYSSAADILKGVSFSVQKGHVVSIIGPNGAGKSTVFRVIYGFVAIRAGNIHFLGKDIAALKPGERLLKGISYCPQGRCNFPLMTVTENLEMGAYTRRDKLIKSDIARIFDMFPLLAEKRNELAGNLSGGQQQVLEMAMALLLKPKLLLLDEPSLGLAPSMMDLVFDEVQRIRSSGTTILIVEQNARRSLEVSDHALVISLGTVAFEGTGDEILNNDKVKKLYLGG